MGAVMSARRFAPLLAVGVLLAAAIIAAALATPQIGSVPVPRGAQSTPRDDVTRGPTPQQRIPSEHAGQVQTGWSPPGWLVGSLTGLCVALVAGVVGLIIWLMVRDSLRRRRGVLPADDEPPPSAADQRERVLAAVDAGLVDLDDADADPRRAVIACWVRLEEAAAAAGTPRHVGDSPTDLVLRLLGAHQISATVLYPLAEAYRRARYATHSVDAGTRDQARAALRQLRAELSHQPAMGTPR